MARRTFRPGEIAFIVGVPLAWAILLVFHPTGSGDFYPVVRDELTAWLAVHLGMVVFIPLIAAAVFLLLRGVEGTAATVARVALGFFVVLYLTFEVALGVGLGILIDRDELLGAGATEAVQSYSESTIILVFEYAGSLAWYVAIVAAAVALVRHAGAPRSVAVLLVLAAVPISFHVPPFAQVGLALFIAAALLVFRASSAPRETPLSRAHPHPA